MEVEPSTLPGSEQLEGCSKMEQVIVTLSNINRSDSRVDKSSAYGAVSPRLDSKSNHTTDSKIGRRSFPCMMPKS